MSETRVAERPTMADPFAPDYSQFEQEATNLPALAARQAAVPGSATDRALAEVVTAQKVAQKRDIGRVMLECRRLGAMAGGQFYYSIPFKNRKKGTTDFVEGISIKGAMAVAATYGNAKVEAMVVGETQAHWIFGARFIDYETGFTLIRTFQQRKGQGTGMSDKERELDIVYQIGQSKALRNVIKDALPMYCDEAFQAAKQGIVDRIGKNMEETRKYILKQLEEADFPVARVERMHSRKADKWTARDMAAIVSEIQQVKDGMALAEEVWPEADEDGVVPGDEAEAKPTPKPKANARPKPANTDNAARSEEKKPEPKPAPKPAPAPEPEPETHQGHGDDGQDGEHGEQPGADDDTGGTSDGLDFGS